MSTVHLPAVAPAGHIFRLAKLVQISDRPAPMLLAGTPWFEYRDPALQLAGSVPGAVVVLVRIPATLTITDA